MSRLSSIGGWFLLVSLACVVFHHGHFVAAEGDILGLMHWCDALCLCQDDSLEKLQCFQEEELYSLLEMSPRRKSALKRANFSLKEKLKWCSDTCLCHKSNEKHFKCADEDDLVSFITNTSPSLVNLLAPVEIYDLRDTIERQEEADSIPAEEEPTHDRHQRKKNKKRKNKNRNRHHHPEPTTEAEALTTSQPLIYELASTTESTTASAVVHHAGVFGGVASTSKSSSPMQESPPAEAEMPLQRKTVASEVSEDLEELRDHVDQIKVDVELNQRILLVTVAVAAVAMIGVLILAIYSCCVRKNSNGSKFRKGHPNQDENSMTKVHLEEAW